MHKRTKRGLSAILALLMLGSVSVMAFEGNPETSHVYSWVANDYDGRENEIGVGNQIPHEVGAIFVSPDGTVYTNCEWEENGQNFAAIKDGVVVSVGSQSHGWGYEGGIALTANDKYIYYGQKSENEGGHLYDSFPTKYPPTGYDWQGIQRRLRSDIKVGAPFEGGTGRNGAYASVEGSFKPVYANTHGDNSYITGLAATNEKLFIAARKENKIWVYDAETMKELDIWEVESPNTIVLDKNGVLWVNQTSTNKIISIDQEGNPLKGEISFPEEVKPWAMCVDNQNRLMISDHGPKEWIMVYDSLDSTPTLSHTIGEEGGIYSGTPGRVGDMKFNHITGLGVDKEDNLYVANGGQYYVTFDEYYLTCSGATYIESYDKNGKKLWDAHGLNFVDTVTLDPQEENKVYSDAYVFEMDYSKSPGEEWSYYSYTLDPHRFPDDPRLHYQNVAFFTASQVVTLQGQKLLVLEDMNGESFGIYRYDPDNYGEIAIPAAFFTYSRGSSWPPGNPGEGYFAWIDQNGDGQMTEDEYFKQPQDMCDVGRNWFVDKKGNIWRCTNNGNVSKLSFEGFNRYGVPRWNMERADVYNIRQDFPNEMARRVFYDADTDMMYVASQSQDPRMSWRDAGDRLTAYSDWSSLNNRKVAYSINLPLGEVIGYTGTNNSPVSLFVEGDYVFFGYFDRPHTYILKKTTGELYDILVPPEDNGRWWALVDTTVSYRAHQLSSGEYLIFVEDDLKSKNWMIRWTDKGGPKNFNEDKALGVSLDSRQLIFDDQEPIIADGRTLVPMRFIFEALGAEVAWNGETRTVTGSKDGKSVILTIDSTTATINGAQMELDVGAQIVNDRTMVPLRVVAEGLGVEVDWLPEESLVNIRTNQEYLKSLGEPEKVQ